MLDSPLFTHGCDVVAIPSVLLGGATASQAYVIKQDKGRVHELHESTRKEIEQLGLGKHIAQEVRNLFLQRYPKEKTTDDR